MFSCALHCLPLLQLFFVSVWVYLFHIRGLPVTSGHLLHWRVKHPRPPGSSRSMDRIYKWWALLQCDTDKSWSFHKKLFLLDKSVSPERNLSFSSLAEHKASCQHFGREESTGVSLFRMQTFIWSLLIFILPVPPWCLLSSNPNLTWLNFSRMWTVCWLPWTSGIWSLCFLNTFNLFTYLPFYPSPSSSKVPGTPSSWAFPDFASAKHPAFWWFLLTSLNFTLNLMLCLSYHWFILFWAFKISLTFVHQYNLFFYSLHPLRFKTFYIITVYHWVSGTKFNSKYIFYYFHLKHIKSILPYLNIENIIFDDYIVLFLTIYL